MEIRSSVQENHDDDTEPPLSGPSLDVAHMMSRRPWSTIESFDDTIEYMELLKLLTSQQSYADMRTDQFVNQEIELRRQLDMARADESLDLIPRRFSHRALAWLFNR